ncbi:hypothetical protein E2C01_070968 [Portunus trituberculatus]|uniref:Uncharacterized protein n=1 Tax=Portunus trituberculatus TaxID=210409 RepID=A0A5B7HYR9_PORTR|nr:hypothetical protein [Portunus trituberculatus]
MSLSYLEKGLRETSMSVNTTIHRVCSARIAASNGASEPPVTPEKPSLTEGDLREVQQVVGCMHRRCEGR